jgi:hypothetical protein
VLSYDKFCETLIVRTGQFYRVFERNYLAFGLIVSNPFSVCPCRQKPRKYPVSSCVLNVLPDFILVMIVLMVFGDEFIM